MRAFARGTARVAPWMWRRTSYGTSAKKAVAAVAASAITVAVSAEGWIWYVSSRLASEAFERAALAANLSVALLRRKRLASIVAESVETRMTTLSRAHWTRDRLNASRTLQGLNDRPSCGGRRDPAGRGTVPSSHGARVACGRRPREGRVIESLRDSHAGPVDAPPRCGRATGRPRRVPGRVPRSRSRRRPG